MNVGSIRLAGRVKRDPMSSDQSPDGAARRQRQIGYVLGVAASLAAILAVVHRSGWTALAVLILSVLFIGRRCLGRVGKLILFASVPYEIIWAVFVPGRGLGDEAPWIERVRLWPRQWDVWLFGGEMPTTRLQRHLFDPDHLKPWDYFFTGVHISFFFVPFIAFMFLYWVDVPRGRRFLVALALLLAMGLPGFALLPGNPPWMNPATDDPNPARAYRINAYVATDIGIDVFSPDGTLDAEENSMAVLPSIHMAVTLLLALSAPIGRRRWRRLTRVYAALMVFSLVYLGEHQFVDEITGIALALLAWRWSPWVQAALGRRFAPFGNAVSARARSLGARLGRKEDDAVLEGGSAR